VTQTETGGHFGLPGAVKDRSHSTVAHYPRLKGNMSGRWARVALSLVWLVLIVAQLTPPWIPGGHRQLGSELLLFWIVVLAATTCVATSSMLWFRAHRDDTAELGFHAAFLMGVSVLPLVHGVTTPGVLYGPNEATMTAVLWAVPISCLAALPLALPPERMHRLLSRWRWWTGGWITCQMLISVALLIHPSILPFHDMGSIEARMIVLSGAAFVAGLSFRQIKMYEIGGRPASLVVAFAYAAIGASFLVWIADRPLTFGFWLAHALDIAGVSGGTVVGFWLYRRGELEQKLLAPLVARQPLDALEIGLDPTVRRFMADLALKDVVTQVHVARTAETAMKVGEQLGLRPKDLRLLGLGALLHDIGKLEIDDEILKKPGRLTGDEFEYVKTHTAIGERLVQASPALADIGPIVRHHHERIDGRGYPDGLAGEQIPKLARVVAVCDAYDAMVHTRQYRQGMGTDRAAAVLREHAGSQWDSEVVAVLLYLAERGRIPAAPTKLASVAAQVGCSCTHELPEPVG